MRAIPFFKTFPLARVLILCLLNSLSAAAEPPDKSRGIDLAKAQAFKIKKISDYFDPAFAGETKQNEFSSDFEAFTLEAEKLGVFPSTPEFLGWWAKNKQKFLTAESLRSMKDEPLSSFAAILFMRFATEKAIAIDKADPQSPKLRSSGQPTRGDLDLQKNLAQANNSSMSLWVIGAAGGAAAMVGGKVVDVFFHGPIAQIMTTSLEPVIRPVRERIDLAINTHVAPHLVGWAQFVTGENRRRSRAKASAEKGKDLSGSLARYQHPAIGVEEFTDDTEKFYNEFLKADYAWRGWIAPELARARTTGFELLYHQYRLLGEQLNSAQTAINQNTLVQQQINVPALLGAGATSAEVDEFGAMLRERHEAQVYKGLDHPGVKELEPKIESLLKKWTERGIPESKIMAFYESEIEASITRNRPAFLLASVLDGERYFQENNLALKDLPQIQAWQEQAREMTGFYEELAKHQGNIQRFFDKKGLKYDVGARIAERGYPLGGPTRAASNPLSVDCVRNFFKIGRPQL